ncbi:MAG: YncE family protein [Paenibacillaceae bacterium]
MLRILWKLFIGGINIKKILLITFIAVLILTATACGKANKKQAANPSRSPTAAAEKMPEASPNSEIKNKYYFTADEGGSITKINAVQNKVVDTIKLEGSVHNVQVSPDGKVLGATLVPKMAGHSNGNSMEMKGFALFFDTATNQLITKVEVGNHPAHIVFTGDQKYVLVTNNEDNNISVIDAKTYQLVQTISTGKGPHGFRVAADSKFAYIANMGEDTVSVIDLTAMKESRKIKVGEVPLTTGVTSDGKLLVVTLNAENAAAIVELASDKVEKIAVGEGPAQVYIQSDDKIAIVANQGTEKKPSNSITKIDLSTKKAVATIETGKGAHGLVTSKDNKFIYVTNMFENTVSVVDNTQNKEITELKVGQTPNGISLMP